MRTPLLLLILSVSGLCSAQSWFPEGATWHYGRAEGFPPLFVGYTQLQVAGDTLLGQEMSKKLERRSRLWLAGTSQVSGGAPSVGFVVNESNGLVRIWVPHQQAYDTLYDMRALPGERWQLPPLPAPIICDSTSYAQVVDTGHVSINGVSLRWLAVDHHFLLNGAEYTVWADTVIERMGLNLSYLTPHGICNAALDEGGEGLLRCYSDAQINYNRFEPWSCEFVLASPDRTGTNARLTIWPNPGRDALHLEIAGRPVLSAELRDALGRTVLERMSILSYNPIDVSSLAPGTYVVQAYTAEGERLVANWVKQ
jgi:hypothetical protein